MKRPGRIDRACSVRGSWFRCPSGSDVDVRVSSTDSLPAKQLDLINRNDNEKNKKKRSTHPGRYTVVQEKQNLCTTSARPPKTTLPTFKLTRSRVISFGVSVRSSLIGSTPTRASHAPSAESSQRGPKMPHPPRHSAPLFLS
jgi:hypothetical protein